MAEFPLVQQLQAELVHEAILALLKDRFGSTPRDITRPLRAILNAKRLKKLAVFATKCPDLAAFREALLA
jgi:hypothetical protein